MRNGLKLLAGILVVYLCGIGWAAFADTKGKATATLDLKAVIHLVVDDNWQDLDIVQKNASAGESAINDWTTEWIDWPEGIALTVKAITNFIVHAYYDFVPSDATYYNQHPFTNENEVIALYDGSNLLKLPRGNSNPVDLFKGTNNVPGGESKKYEVKLNPSNLGDRKAGETFEFTIYVFVEDPTT